MRASPCAFVHHLVLLCVSVVDERACSFSFLQEKERCLTTSCDGTIKVWNTKWGTCVATIKGHSAAVNWCAPLAPPLRPPCALLSLSTVLRVRACYSHDGQFFYSASSDYTIREWQANPPFKCQSIIIGTPHA